MLKHILPLLLASSNAFAAELPCKVATNPSSMKATIRSYDGKPAKVAQVASASLVVGDAHGQDSVRLRVQTTNGISGEAYAFYNQSADGYSVECDGGKVNFLNGTLSANGETVLVSDGVRLDILGCDGEMYVESKGTTFVPGTCPALPPAPATN